MTKIPSQKVGNWCFECFADFEMRTKNGQTITLFIEDLLGLEQL